MVQVHALFVVNVSKDHRDHHAAHISSKAQVKPPHQVGAITVQMMMTTTMSFGKQPLHGVSLSEV